VSGHDVVEDVVYERHGVKVTAFSVDHGNVAITAFGYRIANEFPGLLAASHGWAAAEILESEARPSHRGNVSTDACQPSASRRSRVLAPPADDQAHWGGPAGVPPATSPWLNETEAGPLVEQVQMRDIDAEANALVDDD